MDTELNAKVEKFFSRYKLMHFEKHDIILRPSEPPPGIMYLKKGLVRQYVLSKRGDVLVVHIFRPGSFFLMMWAINNTQNTYYYDAITPVELWRAPLKEVNKFIKNDPELLYDLTHRILKGLEGILKRLEYLTFDSAFIKVSSLLSYFARNFGRKVKNGVIIEYPLTHREIAAWIGTARETVSLQIEDLIHKGLLTHKGRSIIVKDMKKLEKEALITELI